MFERIPILDYFAFFVLYIGSLYFTYQKYAEIIGISVLFVVNAAFMLFTFGNISNKLGNEILPNVAVLSVLISILFHFISLIFVFMMLTNLNTKYTATRGTPIDLPPKYADKLNTFKQNMVICFVFGTYVLTMLLNGYFYNIINVNIIHSMRPYTSYDNIYRIATLISSILLITYSSIQISDTSEFSKLSRKELIY